MLAPGAIFSGRTTVTIVNKSQLSSGLNIAYKDESNIFTEVQKIQKDADTLLTLYRNANANDSTIGVTFSANDSASNETIYCEIFPQIADNTNGSEDGRMLFNVTIAGVSTSVGRFNESGKFQCGGSNQRVEFDETGLTSKRTFTFPDVNSRLGSDSYVDNVKRKIGFIEDCFGDPLNLDASSPLSPTSSGTNSGVTLNAGAENGHFGLWQLDTGTTTTGTAGIIAGAFSSFAIGQGAIVIEFQVKFPTLSTSGQEYSFKMGLVDVLSGVSADAVHLTYNRVSTGDFWVASTSNNSTATNTASNTAVAADTWYIGRIEINAAGTSARFFINGTELNISPISTNLPGSGRFLTWGGHILKSAGTTARTATLDYYACDYDLTSVRS